ncbi:MAG: RHS repeat protein, partial [Lachnospiraceae bacterium]|nr:RHS repeat protein [Lachnospiraceae bacterium]
MKGVRAENFEYDKLNRLKKVVYDTGEILTYEYDANGNIKSVQRTNKYGTGTDQETSNDVNNNPNQGSNNGNGSNLS